jgi:Zn-dependent peptidase ImmA (M78 family)
MAKFFRVSKLVIARRALDQKLVDQDFYDEVAEKSRKVKKSGAPTADITIPVRNGKRFTKTVLASAMSGETLLRDAGTLLNVRADTVASLGAKTGKVNRG